MTPSMTQMWKGRCAVSAEPNRWRGLFLQFYCIPAIHGGQMKVTAPKRALVGVLGEHSRSRVSSALSATASTRPTRRASRCKKQRNRWDWFKSYY